MKKLFFCAAMVAAMMLTACGGKSGSTQLDENGQAAFQELTEKLQTEAVRKHSQVEVSLRGNDLVICELASAAEVKGEDIREAIAAFNAMGEKKVAHVLIQGLDYRAYQMLTDFLHEYKLNVAMQIKIKETGEMGEYIIHNENIPD